MCDCESPSQQCTHLTTLTVPYHQNTTYFDRHELSHLPYQKKRTLTTLTTQDRVLITVCCSPLSWVGTTSKLKCNWSVLQQGRLPMTSIVLFVQCTGIDNNNAFTWVTWELCGIRAIIQLYNYKQWDDSRKFAHPLRRWEAYSTLVPVHSSWYSDLQSGWVHSTRKPVLYHRP